MKKKNEIKSFDEQMDEELSWSGRDYEGNEDNEIDQVILAQLVQKYTIQYDIRGAKQAMIAALDEMGIQNSEIVAYMSMSPQAVNNARIKIKTRLNRQLNDKYYAQQKALSYTGKTTWVAITGTERDRDVEIFRSEEEAIASAQAYVHHLNKHQIKDAYSCAALINVRKDVDNDDVEYLDTSEYIDSFDAVEDFHVRRAGEEQRAYDHE